MTRVAYIVGGSLFLVLGLAACSSDAPSTPSGGLVGDAGSGGSSGQGGSDAAGGNNAGGDGNSAGTTGTPGAGGDGNNAGAGGSPGVGGSGGAGGTAQTFGGGGAGGTKSAGGSGGTGGTGTGQDCNTCIGSSCSAEGTACQQNADCAKILQCAGTCKDAACLQGCVTSNPGGEAAFTALDQCVNNNCATACSGGGMGGAAGGGGSGGAASGVCDSKLTTNNAACDSCLGADATCCQDTKDCLADADCKTCLTDAKADQTKCAANAKFSGFTNCYSKTCAAACGGGSSGSQICDSKITTNKAACDKCIGDAAGCCQATKDCLADAECKTCLTDAKADQTKCAANAKVTAFGACQQGCAASCM